MFVRLKKIKVRFGFGSGSALKVRVRVRFGKIQKFGFGRSLMWETRLHYVGLDFQGQTL